jgi:hypothetical protein
LISETRQRIPVKKGQPERYDYEYRREGTANLFMFFAPLLNWRHIKVTDQRTKVDWAVCMEELVTSISRMRSVASWWKTTSIRTIRLLCMKPLRPPKPVHLGSVRASLHAKTWQLAQYGRD